MPVLAENATIAEHIRLRRPRTQFVHPVPPVPDPTPRIPSIIQSTRCKSAISSLLHSTFAPGGGEPAAPAAARRKANNFTSTTFKGLGCTAAAAADRVSVPAVIRNSADWDAKKGRDSKKKKKKSVSQQQKKSAGSNNDNGVGENGGRKTIQGVLVDGSGCGNSAACAVVPDVWCGPGIGFSAADDAAPVDCVVARRNVGGRGKIDVEKTNQRERSSYAVRRTVNPETLSFLDSDPFIATYPEPELYGARHYRHARHPSHEGFTEIMMLHGGLLTGGRLDMPDRFSAWRLDVDSMSYEELLELGERIGYVNTGLKEDEISHCIRKFKLSILNDLSSYLPMQFERKCSICQEEYEADDEIGKLSCGHGYHIHCIKQWLSQKNACPVCKTAAVTR